MLMPTQKRSELPSGGSVAVFLCKGEWLMKEENIQHGIKTIQVEWYTFIFQIQWLIVVTLFSSCHHRSLFVYVIYNGNLKTFIISGKSNT